jgi:2-octaprenyl-6-methoxyphenol hydroxylase
MQIERPASYYDIVVVGAGMVGASFANLLARALGEQSYSMLVVEAVATRAPEQPSFDARSTALSFGSRKIFSRMQAWEQLAELVTPIQVIQVSDQGHFGSVLMSHREHRQDALGYVIENRQLGQVLNPMLQESPAIDFLAPATIVDSRPVADGMDLSLQVAGEEQQVRASLVVLADGGRSPVSEKLGIEQQRKAYDQKAIIANIGFSKAHNNVAYERFTDSGPLAVLPLSDYQGQHRGALVWTVATGEADAILAADDQSLLADLKLRFGRRLGDLTQIGQRAAYPLTLSVARESVRPSLVLLGNVAHTLHPVAGQGLNLALRACDCLVDKLVEARQNEIAPGSMTVLHAYQQARESDQQAAITLTDQMIAWFSSNRPERVLARKAGLLAIDLVPGLRRGFARQAMGLNSW